MSLNDSIVEIFDAQLSKLFALDIEENEVFRIKNVFKLEDGSSLPIYLKKVGNDWVFSDKGTTLKRLEDCPDSIIALLVKATQETTPIRKEDDTLSLLSTDPNKITEQFFAFAQCLLFIIYSVKAYAYAENESKKAEEELLKQFLKMKTKEESTTNERPPFFPWLDISGNSSTD